MEELNSVAQAAPRKTCESLTVSSIEGSASDSARSAEVAHVILKMVWLQPEMGRMVVETRCGFNFVLKEGKNKS